MKAKVRELWPRHAPVLPPAPRVTLSAHLTSALIVHFYGSELFVSPGPLGTVGSGERECGNLSPARKSGEDPSSSGI